jgi:hypothetical protein
MGCQIDVVRQTENRKLDIKTIKGLKDKKG